ncbi:tryptophan-rich sensory protein [Microbacterium sp. SLBN-146]|uniref:tryptophan-rich sensory protein n=1 Tax=Microbacterium sp. SLBN-146 TaxID=2768457 RepID=UPI00114E338C|nr:tryptophan-rich sensory protein [Microbacterium sp. SLBN-146]
MQSTGKDLARQIVVISTAVFMLIASLVGSGVLGGTPVQELQDGALAADGSLLAPASPAFSIWSVIYVLLIGYAIWQALPGQRARERQRALGWWIALSMVFNGLWLVLAQFATLPLTVAGIVALLIVLCITFQRTVVYPAEGLFDSLLIDGSTGLHLGWVSLATVANTSAWLTAEGPSSWESFGTTAGVLVLIVVGLIGLALTWRSGWRIAPALALGWGLSWLAVGRLQLEPHDTAIGVTAAIVAVVIPLVAILGTVSSRLVGARNAGA